jgi:hypothetical protein
MTAHQSFAFSYALERTVFRMVVHYKPDHPVPVSGCDAWQNEKAGPEKYENKFEYKNTNYLAPAAERVAEHYRLNRQAAGNTQTAPSVADRNNAYH